RSIEALSSVTSTAGSFGKAFGSTRPSVPGSAFTHGASSNGSLPNEHTVRLPLARRNEASPSIDPRASGSGFTWQARAISSASTRAAAAALSAAMMAEEVSVATGALLAMPLLQKLLHALSPLGPLVLAELEVGDELDPDLAAQRGPQVRAGGTQGRPGGALVPVLAQDGVEHASLSQVGGDADAGDGDESHARILEPLDLLGQHLPQFLGHAVEPLGHGQSSG